jgi:putative transposase
VLPAKFLLPSLPGFQGLREDLPLEVYVRHLPHWRQIGATYFVTYRLHDSLPRVKLDALQRWKTDWESRNPPPRSHEQLDELAKETMRRVEHWLDQGAGECVLRQRPVADVMVEELHRHDGNHYELGCYVVMPNHVHAVVRPLAPTSRSLEKILQSWKGASSMRANVILGRDGTFWFEESFDRIIRDGEHLYRAIQYIGRNPAKARIRAEQCRLWLQPSWIKLGWHFEDAR